MATVLSEQITKIDSVAFDMLQPNEAHGRERIAFFKYTTPASVGLADGDIVALCEIPKGARVTGGLICFEALGTSVVGKVGIVGSDAKYLTAGTSMAAIGTALLASTIALNHGVQTTAKERIILTLSGAAPAASKIITGVVRYVVD